MHSRVAFLLSGRLSGMSVIPEPQEARKWLVLAYGDSAAEEAMTLPWDLRLSLYGSVLLYGPAGDEIRRLIDALDKALLAEASEFAQGLILERPIWATLLRLEQLRIDPYFVLGAGDLTVWAQREENRDWYFRLRSDLNLITLRNQAGVLPLLMLLNGQYLFEPGLVALDSPFLQRANSLLGLLGIPSLRGALAVPAMEAHSSAG